MEVIEGYTLVLSVSVISCLIKYNDHDSCSHSVFISVPFCHSDDTIYYSLQCTVLFKKYLTLILKPIMRVKNALGKNLSLVLIFITFPV